MCVYPQLYMHETVFVWTCEWNVVNHHQPLITPCCVSLYCGEVACVSFLCVHVHATYVCTTITYVCTVLHGQMYIMNVLYGDIKASRFKINKIGFMTWNEICFMSLLDTHGHVYDRKRSFLHLDHLRLPWWSLSVNSDEWLLFESRTECWSHYQSSSPALVLYWSTLLHSPVLFFPLSF